MRYEHIWDTDTGTATCRIYDKNNVFEGVAHCHEQDADFMSERTGCYIAESRAGLARLRHKRDNILRPQIKSLMDFYHNLKDRKHFDPTNPMIGILFQHINKLNHELSELEQDIRLEKTYLQDYIHNKDIIYEKIRKANAQ